MNLSQLRELKVGDKIVCKHLLAFTDGKAYTVRPTSVGITVTDDRGSDRFLSNLEWLFEKVDGEEST